MEAPEEIYLVGDPALGCDAWQWVERVEPGNGLPTRYVRADAVAATLAAAERRATDAEAQLEPGSPTERAPTVWAYEQACAALATTKAHLAAAEARATEAAAEAGKWQAEAKAHAARCAVLEKADAAPYCEGQCGICDCQAEPAWSQQRACPNCQSTDWQELAPGFGCNQCQGL